MLILMWKVSMQQQATDAPSSSLLTPRTEFTTLPPIKTCTHTGKVLERWEEMPFLLSGLHGLFFCLKQLKAMVLKQTVLHSSIAFLRYGQLKVLKLYICCVKFLNTLLPQENTGRAPRFSFKKHHINILVYLRFNISYSFLCTFYCSYLQCTWNTLCNWQRAQIFHLGTVWWFHFFFFLFFFPKQQVLYIVNNASHHNIISFWIFITFLPPYIF